MEEKEICYYPIEIPIPKAGVTIKIEQALPLLFENVEGVVVLNPCGRHGEGELTLSVGGEEIFPDGFHARAFMYNQSSNHKEEIITRSLDRYMYAFTEKAKGATLSATYKEPENEKKGVLYLVFKLTKTQTC